MKNWKINFKSLKRTFRAVESDRRAFHSRAFPIFEGGPGSGKHHNKGRRRSGAGESVPAGYKVSWPEKMRGTKRQYAQRWRALEKEITQKAIGNQIQYYKTKDPKYLERAKTLSARLAKIRSSGIRPPVIKYNPRWRAKPSN